MSVVTVHRLLSKDVNTLTAQCSVCGLVAIRKAGDGFQCAVKKAAGQRAWTEKNPDKAKANRLLRSDHELFNRDYLQLTAQCVICGPVPMTAWGRGYTCGLRAAQLRVIQEDTPHPECSTCRVVDHLRVYLLADGSCARCAGATFTPTRQLDDEFYGQGFTIRYDDDDTDDREPAVRGWVTIGSERPWHEA